MALTYNLFQFLKSFIVRAKIEHRNHTNHLIRFAKLNKDRKKQYSSGR